MYASAALKNMAPSNMAKGQLITNEVLDQTLLDAIISIPREKCVPLSLSGAAYVDDDLEIAPGRFLPAPLTFARMLMLANIQPADKVLDVGALQGYSTAVIARLAASVIGIETDADMAAIAKRNVTAFGAENATVATVSRFEGGYVAEALYDVIILEGSVAVKPGELLRQLKNGGRLITVEMKSPRAGSQEGLGRLTEYVNRDSEFFSKQTLDISLPLLPGFDARAEFSFD